jgi:cobalt-zinc-cadmium efflux system outer membrane protein
MHFGKEQESMRVGTMTMWQLFGAFAVALMLPGAAAAQVGPPMTRVSMDDAIRLAIERNQSLTAQRLAIDASKADEITAALKPNPGLSVGADGLALFSPSQLTPGFLKDNVAYSGSLSYLFERGGKRGQRITVAQDTTDLTAKTVLDAERQLRFQTEQAFIGVLLAKSVLDLAQQNLTSFSDVVDINQQRVASGDLAEGDFFKISIQKLQFEQDVSAGEVGLVQAKANLRQLVGYDTVSEDFDVVGDLTYVKREANLDDLKQQALAARADLLAAQSGVRLAQDTVKREHANAARDLAGNASYTHTGPDNSVGVGASIDLPIHDRNQGNIAHAEVAARQAVETEIATRYGVMTDVVNAYAAFQTNDKVVNLFQSGYLDQSRQSLDISQYVFERGAGSLLDLLDAERTERETQLAYREALAAYLTSVRQINFAVGRQVMP